MDPFGLQQILTVVRVNQIFCGSASVVISSYGKDMRVDIWLLELIFTMAYVDAVGCRSWGVGQMWAMVQYKACGGNLSFGVPEARGVQTRCP